MDLATVKAKVKAWEKGFRASHGREPTKNDIKQDASDIAEMYALYRKLSKSQANGKTASSSSSTAKPSKNPAVSSSSTLASVSTNTSTPRKDPAARPPATPTPPARRSSTASATTTAAPPLPRFMDESPESGPSRAAATAAEVVTPQKRAALFTTPKKKKEGYVGPIADPLPNPFSVTPRKGNKTIATTSSANPNRVVAREVFESPFIHATSPRKLKEVLEANSLRATRERAAGNSSVTSRMMDITPRTKARKRLAGEDVEGTPAKAPRRRRGDRPTGTVIPGAAPAPPEESDGDDEFGETPIKPGVATFGLIDDGNKQQAPRNGMHDTKSKSRTGMDLFPIFQRAKRASDEPQNGRHAKRRTSAAPAPPVVDATDDEMDGPGSPTPTSARLDDSVSVVSSSAVPDDRLPTSPDDPAVPADSAVFAPAPKRTPRPKDRARVLTLSEDEWDPEADTRTVRVVGTRRAAIRVAPVAGLASDDEDEVEEGAGNGHAEDMDDGNGGDGEEDEVEDENGQDETGDNGTQTDKLLSFLSLRSPIARTGERLADLRVRALLDPTSAAAAALRAARRGQEVFVCGEVDGEGDEWDLKIEEEAREGDDDWESDPEGWKAVRDDEEW